MEAHEMGQSVQSNVPIFSSHLIPLGALQGMETEFAKNRHQVRSSILATVIMWDESKMV